MITNHDTTDNASSGHMAQPPFMNHSNPPISNSKSAPQPNQLRKGGTNTAKPAAPAASTLPGKPPALSSRASPIVQASFPLSKAIPTKTS
jgi:hypothetical protein